VFSGGSVEAKKGVTAAHLVLMSGVFKITTGNVVVTGDFLCFGDECGQTKSKASVLTFDRSEKEMCEAGDDDGDDDGDGDGDVCAASAWESKIKGIFSDPKGWAKKSVPKSNSIVVFSGGSVEAKKGVTAAHLVLMSGVFKITTGNVVVTGDFLCFGDECGQTKSKASVLTFDRSEKEMCEAGDDDGDDDGDGDGDVCAASAWESKIKGIFSDPKGWAKKSVPKSNSIVVFSGGSVEAKKGVTAAHLVLSCIYFPAVLC
jgi:hypothetical protein